MSLLLLLGALTGCYTKEEFQTDYNTSTCEWFDSCGFLPALGYDSVDECIDERDRLDDRDSEEGIDNCAEYDPDNAKTCIEDLESLSCEDYEEEFSASCEAACGDN